MIHETFSVDGGADLEVRIETGRVEIMPGAAGVIDVKVDTKIPDFIVEQRGNSILISSDKNSSWLSRGSAFVVVEVPEGIDLRVGVASAHVSSAAHLGKVDIRTASGDIDLASADTLTVKTASGDLDVRRVDRALRFNSASGDLRVAEHVGGALNVSTASGDVHVEHSDATVELNSASGDTYISYFAGRSATFKAMSGDVDLGIPPRTNVDLDVSLLSGKIRLPDPPARKEPPLRHMSIKAKTVSGDFTINLVDG